MSCVRFHWEEGLTVGGGGYLLGPPGVKGEVLRVCAYRQTDRHVGTITFKLITS